MKILIQYLKRHWKLVLLALLLAAVNQCFSLLDPLIAGKMLDRFAMHVSDYNDDFTNFFNAIIWFLLASMGVALVSRIAKNLQDYFVNVIVQRTGAEMYSDGIKHSLELPYQVFEDQRSGETLGKLQKVRADSEKFINAFLSILFQSVVGIIFVMAYAINVHWSIAPVFLLTVPVLAIVSNMLSKKIKLISKKILGETTSLAGATTESLRNIELVKSLGLANQEINRLNTVTDKILGLELKKVKYIRSLSFIQGTTVNFLRTLFVFLLYYLIFKDEISPGKMMTLMFYSFFIFGPLQELGNVIAIYREAQASLTTFSQILEMPLEHKPQSPHQLNDIETFAFRDVSFKHISAPNNALSHINFTAKRGQTIAFVGPSGSGKSTLVKLLVGLYHPASGQILYNGTDSNSINLDDLRGQIGFVTQDTQLFAGTIRENLLFVNPQAADEQILNALKMASCNSLLERAENGLNTIIGEGGVKVSGGEKQRLSIARALLRNPKLLVLDEATSALDSITEEEITETIKTINKNKNLITILIAHRLSTIMHADKIYVLEKGHKIEEGTHDSLLAEKGLYYAMWRQQIGERKKGENVVTA
ncbi:MAG: ABC transporter ATP-binding protein [Bacteroidia bacterium]|nr:ABC transporter ATP-binding protein [Bacteroidia bacterium]